ncbi:BA75_03580T0 [Komagataella pastoris]|uniref:Pre-mRNA-processing protein 45 n=1 Tax=Komagataella pastoris TaxID=4922 RepID=A0A1B2JG59_PICPA|nr:BA75_03580T0 [Komagataella pastoris]
MQSISSFLPEPKNTSKRSIPNRSQNKNQILIPLEAKELSTVNYQQASYGDLIPLRHTTKDIDLTRPSGEEIANCTERTKRALERIINDKLHAANPSSIGKPSKGPQFVKYTPASLEGNSQQRTIKIVERQKDPMLPSSVKHRKVPQGPPPPPPPVLHTSSKKASNEEQKNWHIPPAVSNWKNPKGFTIAVDKRMAAMADDPDRTNVNQEGFSNLAEALEKADKSARENIKLRNEVQKKIKEKERLEQEEKLRLMAVKAREARLAKSQRGRESIDDSKLAGLSEREAIRAERRRRAERELKLTRNQDESQIAMFTKDRDISNEVVLGQSSRKETQSMESQFDSRLFLKASGTNAKSSEDQIYNEPLFAAQEVISSIYRPKQLETLQDDVNPDEELRKINKNAKFEVLGKAKLGFSGTDGLQPSTGGPVRFEKEFVKRPASDDEVQDRQSEEAYKRTKQ